MTIQYTPRHNPSNRIAFAFVDYTGMRRKCSDWRIALFDSTLSIIYPLYISIPFHIYLYFYIFYIIYTYIYIHNINYCSAPYHNFFILPLLHSPIVSLHNYLLLSFPISIYLNAIYTCRSDHSYYYCFACISCPLFTRSLSVCIVPSFRRCAFPSFLCFIPLR